MSALTFPKEKIKILLLEDIHRSAVETLRANGYANVESLSGALAGAALREKIKGVHILGIRSTTKLTEDVFEAADRLFCVGCFCIGVNQVDIQAARRKGVPVFNAPFSNTRSVAELVLAEAVMLVRGIAEKNSLAHQGRWQKSAKGAHEIRGKTLGVIGYGHIGAQVSVLAESFGMNVIYYDIEKKLGFGNARASDTLDALLREADIVTLHVPASPATRNMIGEKQLRDMKPGTCLINASRGNVVDLAALDAALASGHLFGAALDVFPEEPKSEKELFKCPLQGYDNVILTPHIGGSTEEAQENIGREVAEKFVRYSDNGSTAGAVNFARVSLPPHEGRSRFLHIHENKPGVLEAVNAVFAGRGVNIAGQFLETDREIGYLVCDVEGRIDRSIADALKAAPHTIRSRILY